MKEKIEKIKKYKEILSSLRREKENIENRIAKGSKILQQEEYALQQEERANVRNSIEPEIWQNWLLVLLKNMQFEGIWYGDLVSIGVEGKRPFGSSSGDYDIPRILSWNEDEMSEKKIQSLINALLDDLPNFLNDLIKKSN